MGGGCFITILYTCDPFFLSFATKLTHITLHRQPSDKSQMALTQGVPLDVRWWLMMEVMVIAKL
ncbi:hypothetical protein HanXRQr2_Chr02g0074431 [Helianthus annuus]|uniref:Uncharacterized protein n=1 Tax=Helianthus annuus TaxID=4232 RepID=A0A251VHQ3_HELAN|nr:hypothetical protein HanXRQr2_Chr02g0074431 [Helianthus annuus]KAJ0619372.1 hypothetical protein HanHA89_Chr02g0070651 [Helianthus annuus]